MFFIKTGNADAELSDVASSVFRAIGISTFEERDSSNYPPNDHYFAGYCENATVKVYDAYDGVPRRTPVYPFRVSVEDPRKWRIAPGMIAGDVETIAKAIAGQGFTVFVPTGKWATTAWDGRGDLYGADI